MSVLENIGAKGIALNEMKEHCLFLRMDGDIVYLPDGYSIDAIRVNQTAKGYKLATEYLEKVWQESLWWK